MRLYTNHELPMRYFILSILFCMLSVMGFAQSVVYTVISRDKVRADGDEPFGAYAEYAQDGSQKSRLTANSKATLSLYGYQNISIEQVTLRMRSNTSAGGGSLIVSFDNTRDTIISKASFSNEAWAGQFTTAYTDIRIDLHPHIYATTGQPIEIIIVSSENSLYIESYSINYTTTAETYTVYFSTYSEQQISPIEEQVPGQGIVLPHLEDANGFYAIGWAENMIEPTEDTPLILKAGDHYYPTSNSRLHAVYCDFLPEENIEQDTTYTTNIYTIADIRNHCLAMGYSQSNGKMQTITLQDTLKKNDKQLYEISLDDFAQGSLYEITFLPDSAATIMEVLSGKYVSPSEDDVVALNSSGRAWRYRVLTTDKTVVFYQVYSSHTRVLTASYGETMSTIDELTFRNPTINLSSVHDSAIALFALPEERTVTYSSHPSPASLEEIVESREVEDSMPQKVMIDGSIYIIMPNGKAYDVMGQMVTNSRRRN